MTSPKTSPLLRRYVAARQQLADLDAQRDYLAGLSRDALDRFDQASHMERPQAGLEHDALQRAATLFAASYDQPTRSRLQATMQTTGAALEASGTDPEQEARRLDYLRAARSRKATLGEIRDRVREALDRANANEAARRLRAQIDAELEPTPDEQAPPARPSNAPALVLSPLDPMGSDAPTPPAPDDDPGRSFAELDERLAGITRRLAADSPRASRWLRLRRLFRLA